MKTLTKITLSIILIVLGFSAVNAQVAININGANPDESAMLDVGSTTKGILVPRLTQSQRNAIDTPASGLLIYQNDNTSGFYYYDGSVWQLLAKNGDAWSLTGNTGTIPITNYIGTTDNQDFVIKVNNVEKIRVNKTNGAIETKNTGESVFVGESAGINDDLSNNKNVFIGYQSGTSNSTGSSNVFVGYQSGLNTTTGDFNTADGYKSIYSNTTGHRNTAIGGYALYSNSNGTYNTASGFFSLYSNNSGTYNTANGYMALYSNTSASYNTANGCEALYSNTTGAYNTAHGFKSLYSNTSGTSNTSNGYEALYSNTTGINNSANGYQALYYNSNNKNTANGYQALYNNISGYNNSANGYRALFSNNTGSQNTANGSQALNSNTTGDHNNANGTRALYYNTTGNDNTANGYKALFYNISGYYNTAIGYNAGPTSGSTDLINTGAFGYNAAPTTSNDIMIGDSYVDWIGGKVTWSTTSDGRFKRNINDNVPGLNFINSLRPVTYQWDLQKLDRHIGIPDSIINEPIMKQGRSDKEQIVYTGFIAQEVEKSAHKFGYNFSGLHIPENEHDTYSIAYAEFVVPLVKAVQELSEKNSKLETENHLLKSKLIEIIRRLEYLEK